MEPEVEFLQNIVSHLVEKHEEVYIDRHVDTMGVLLKLTVAPDEVGRVIGKNGDTVRAMRTLLRAVGAKNKSHVSLSIVDPSKQ